MNILGIDQSQSAAGFALVVWNERIGMPILVDNYLEEYLVNPPRRRRLTLVRDKCLRFEETVLWFMRHRTIDIVITELVHAGNNNRNTSTALGELQGILNTNVPRDIPIYCFNVGTWRAQILTKGYTKDPKQFAIDFALRYANTKLSEHEAEAYCMTAAFPRLRYEKNRSKVEILL